ncbi:MAG: hypothetical protein QXS21_00675 [Thermoproteota archaeon]
MKEGIRPLIGISDFFNESYRIRVYDEKCDNGLLKICIKNSL